MDAAGQGGKGASQKAKDTAGNAGDQAKKQGDQAKKQGDQAKKQGGPTPKNMPGPVSDNASEAPTDDVANGYGDDASQAADGATDAAESVQEQGDDAADTAEGAADDAQGEAEETADDTESKAEGVADDTESKAEGAADDAQGEAEEAADDAEGKAKGAADDAKDKAQDAGEEGEDAAEGAQEKAEGAKDQAEGAAEDAAGEGEGEGDTEDAVAAGQVDDKGNVVDDDGNVIGTVDDPKKFAGSVVDQEGDILDEEGNVLGKAEPIEEGEEGAEKAAEGAEDAAEGAKDKAGDATEGAKDTAEGAVEGAEGKAEDAKDKAEGAEGEAEGAAEDAKEDAKGGAPSAPTVLNSQVPDDINAIPQFEGTLVVQESGEVKDANGKVIGNVVEGDPKEMAKKTVKDIDLEGHLLGEDGTIIGKVGIEELDFGQLEGKTVNKAGKIVDENGDVFGELIEGEARKLVGKKCDAEGMLWNDTGKVIGKAKPYPKADLEKNESFPFEDFVGAKVDKQGNVVYEGQVVGKIVEGDVKKLEGKEIDKEGDVSDKNGNTIGHAERVEDEPEEEIDYSLVEGCKVNKAGNVVNDSGKVVGKLTEGNVKVLNGKTVSKGGKIWNDDGEVVGQASPLKESEREQDSEGPFADFPDALVEKDGKVTFEGQTVGRVIEGDAKTLAGKHVDADGDINDKSGNTVGKAERWEEPEEEPEPEVDQSALSGKRVNKQGNIVDENGAIYGKVVEGDPKKLVGKMCNKEGKIFDEAGTVIGRGEVVPDSERTGSKEGPFSGYEGAKLKSDGKVYYQDEVVGRLIEGDAKKLAGHEVDEEGEINDKNGNVIGKCERFEEEVKEKEKHPCAGLRINKEGTCIGEDGEVRGKLTSGEIPACKGKEVDDDGDVVDGKGNTIGHVTRIEDVEEEVEEAPPEKTEEELAKEKQDKEDRELAGKMSAVIGDCLERVKPVLKNMDETLERHEKTPPEERDEDKCYNEVKPLIEEGGRIMSECNGAIRGLDPDGRMQSQAKAKSKTRDASPEEHALAEQLKELTTTVHESIEKGKRRLRDMPKAKKKLNPLWGLLAEPLGQILAAVGLLLSGVLGLVGKLLGGLGLGGLVNGLLGGLGLDSVLKGLGVDVGGMLGGGKK